MSTCNEKNYTYGNEVHKEKSVVHKVNASYRKKKEIKGVGCVLSKNACK